MIVRRIARPMLAGVFVVSGVDVLRNPGSRVDVAAPTVNALQALSPAPVQPLIPSDPETAVRVNAAAQVGAGLLLATGKFPRVAASVLTASLVPTTAVGHQFWAESDQATRAAHRIHFTKNLAILGGLLLAVVDTEGRPSLAYRGRAAVADAADTVRDRLPAGEAQTVSALAETTSEKFQSGVDRVRGAVDEDTKKAARKAAKRAEKSARKAAKKAARSSAHVADQALHRGAGFAQSAAESAGRWAEQVAEEAPAAGRKAAKKARKAEKKAAAAARTAAARTEDRAAQVAASASRWAEQTVGDEPQELGRKAAKKARKAEKKAAKKARAAAEKAAQRADRLSAHADRFADRAEAAARDGRKKAAAKAEKARDRLADEAEKIRTAVA